MGFDFFTPNVIATLLSLFVSAVGLQILTRTDDKRNHVYGLEKSGLARYRKIALGMVFLSIPVLVMIRYFPALLMWLVGVSLFGWLLAWRKPSAGGRRRPTLLQLFKKAINPRENGAEKSLAQRAFLQSLTAGKKLFLMVLIASLCGVFLGYKMGYLSAQSRAYESLMQGSTPAAVPQLELSRNLSPIGAGASEE